MDLGECKGLLGHAEWADALIWRAVAALGREDEELRQRLHHLHMVQWGYLHIWRAEVIKPRELASFAAISAVRDWARDYYRELLSYLLTVREADLRRDVRFPWADHLVQRFGRAEPTTWSESVLQIAMHSSHHRGQAARRIRELGGEPPLTDFIGWIWMKRPGADWGGEDAA